MPQPRKQPRRPTLWERVAGSPFLYVLATIITCVWALSTVWDIFSASYEANPAIHAVMLAVAGGLFGVGLIKRNGS